MSTFYHSLRGALFGFAVALLAPPDSFLTWGTQVPFFLLCFGTAALDGVFGRTFVVGESR